MTIVNSIKSYVNWNSLALLFSGGLLFQLLLKIIFNIFSKNKISIDKWTIMDSLSAFLNIVAVQLITNIKPDLFLIPQTKDMVDYFMIFVLCIAWLRFFCYFLVIRNISKLLLILVAMIGDTLAFMFILCCFLLIVASVFTTLYQDVNPDKYGSLVITARVLFDAAVGVYDYDNMGGRSLSFSVLQVVYVFFANILLLNYLIAILSSTYDNMKQTGIFKYKVNLYQYCERYMIAFAEPSYGELVLHPPPISYFALAMVPFVLSSFVMRYVTKGFSYVMHWVENVFFIFGFIMYEGCLAPIAYLKIWMNIIVNSVGFIKLVCNCLIWTVTGLPLIFYLILKDTCNLLRILSYH